MTHKITNPLLRNMFLWEMKFFMKTFKDMGTQLNPTWIKEHLYMPLYNQHRKDNPFNDTIELEFSQEQMDTMEQVYKNGELESAIKYMEDNNL